MSLASDLRRAARIAGRELRHDLRARAGGFRVFLACLALGVAAIAAVGTVRDAIGRGLAREGAVILGGDVTVELTYRFAEADERAWFDRVATRVAEIVDFRSLAVVPGPDGAERALTQVKGVDAAYPVYGEVVLDPPMPLAEALNGTGAGPGAVMDRVLADRLELSLPATPFGWARRPSR